MTRTPLRTSVRIGLTLAILTASCSPSATEDDAWGTEADQFFTEWAAAWSSGDGYDTVRFYDPDVDVPLAQDDRDLTLAAGFGATTSIGRGRAWLASWLAEQTKPRTRVLEALYLGEGSAVPVLHIDDLDTAAAFVMTVDDEDITRHLALRWRDAHLAGGSPDTRLDWLDELLEAYLSGWGGGDATVLEPLYTETATVEPFTGSAQGLDDAVSSTDFTLGAATVRTVAPGARSGPAVFVVPGPDFGTAVALVDATTSTGCATELAIVLEFENRTIAAERRYLSIDTVRRCVAEPDRTRSWVGVDVPRPLAEQVTGTLVRPDGSGIAVINGVPPLEELLDWGLDRFSEIGLTPPQLVSVTFAPVPTCASVPGTVTEASDGPDVVVCTDAYTACVPDRFDCTSFRTFDRFALLHELAHAWLLGVDDATRSAFLDLNELAVWRDPTRPWFERGVEHAAETMAWGLLDEEVRLARIGDPPCGQVARGFEVLTGLSLADRCGT